MPAPPPPAARRLFFESDGRHPLIYMYEPPIQPEEYQAAVDELAGTPVDALSLCLGDGRTVLHDTRVGELWGHNVTRWPHLVFRRAHQNAAHLIEQGLDPLALLCARARQVGLRLYPQLLVNLPRGPRDTDCRCSEFRFAHAHLEIGVPAPLDADGRSATCLDFAHDEVRQERFALLAEALTYDVGGLELQLNNFPFYFHPDRVDAGTELMTAWVARIHQAVRASGPGRQLVVRVPSRLRSALAVGLDVAAWVRQGLVDVVVADIFATPALADSSLDVAEFVDLARGTGTQVLAALHSLVDSDRLDQAPIQVLRGLAGNLWDQGVDGLYLAHWFGMWPYGPEFYQALRELKHPEVMAPRDKIVYAPTLTGRYGAPRTEPGEAADLPADLALHRPVTVRLRISDDLARWHAVGRVHEVLLRLRVMNNVETDGLSFRLNGVDLPADGCRRLNEMYRMAAPRFRTGSGTWFIFRLDAAHLPVRGVNEIEVTLRARDADIVPEPCLRDVELETRYLMGKSFHRAFSDPDLGPAERRVA